MRTWLQNQILISQISMFGSKIISGIYNSAKAGSSNCQNFIKNFPSWHQEKLVSFKNYLKDFRYRLSNLSDTNLELGIYHLHQGNLNDALIKFKLIDKFLSPGDPTANYWLGWTYYLKNNIDKALHHLKKAGTTDEVGLQGFLQNLPTCTEIPAAIWQEYRDIIAEYYTTNFRSTTIHLPLTFAETLRNKITTLPDKYSILDLGSNVGLAATEIHKRLPDEFTYTGVEDSEIMQELVPLYYPTEKILDQAITVSVREFLSSNNTSTFDIILSFGGLSFAKDLNPYFQIIYKMLKKDGYFAFCLRSGTAGSFSLKHKEFTHSLPELMQITKQNGFTILSGDEFLLEINNKYSIVIAKK